MINLKSTKKTPSITISPTFTNNTYACADHVQVQSGATTSTVEVGADTPVIERSAEVRSVEATLQEKDRIIEVLKLIINVLQDNPLIVNKYIIADDEVLERIILLLCNAESVNIDAEDVGEGCISKNTYRKINSIYVSVKGETLNLKYDFPAVMKTLKDLRISVKYVW